MDNIISNVYEFHERFNLPLDIPASWRVMWEEYREFLAATAGDDIEHMAEETGDWIYTVIGLARAYGVPQEALQGALERVMDKNSAKTQDTHYKAADGKVRKRPRNSINVWLRGGA